ncbi:MAG: TerC family protein [Burkholderiales bacterium]
MPDWLDSTFWVAVAEHRDRPPAGRNNAVVIALACRRRSGKQRNQGIFWGVFGAVALRVIFFAPQLLALPYLKIVGALYGGKLLQEEGDAHGNKA